MVFSSAGHLKGDYDVLLIVLRVILIMTHNHFYLVVNQNILRILNSFILEIRMGTWMFFLTGSLGGVLFCFVFSL